MKLCKRIHYFFILPGVVGQLVLLALKVGIVQYTQKLLAINREALGGHARVARFKKDQRPVGAAIRTGGSTNMLHPTHEQHFMKKVKPIQNGRRPSRQILQSLYAQMMMEYAVFEFNRERLLRKIDDSLDMHDEKAFKEWTEAYKELMSEYKDGKVLFEQGYKLELEFE